MPSGGRKSYQAQLVIRVSRKLREALERERKAFGVSTTSVLVRMILENVLEIPGAEEEWKRVYRERIRELKKLRG